MKNDPLYDIFDAARTGNTKTISEMIGAGIDPNIKSFCQWTPLFVAVYNNNFDAAKLLIYAGSDVNSIDKDRTSVLMAAVVGATPEIVKLLLDAGAEPNKIDVFGNSALGYAISGFDPMAYIYSYPDKGKCRASKEPFEMVKTLIEAGANINLNKGTKNMTPIEMAAYFGYINIIEYVIAKNEEIVNNNNTLENLIRVAAYFPDKGSGTAEVIKMLTAKGKGVDLNSKGPGFSRTALIHACISGNREAAAMLVASGASADEIDCYNATALMYSARHGCDEIFSLIFDRTTDICAIDVNGRNALDYALWPDLYGRFNYGVIDILLKNNLKWNYTNEELQKVLFRAAREGNINILKLAIGAGADINSKDSRNWTPLMETINYISFSDNFAAARYLIENGADIENCDGNKWNALMVAIEKGHDELVSILIEKSPASVNQRDVRGYSPLRIAVYERRYEIIRRLVVAGADADLEDHKLDTPLLFAVRNRDFESVRILVEQGGADVNKKRSSKETPLNIAAESGQSRIVAYLIGKGATCCYGWYYNENYYLNLINEDIDPDIILINDVPLIFHAVLEGWNELAPALIAKNADLTFKDGGGNNILMAAARGKIGEEVIKKLIETEIFAIDAENHDGDTALSLALNNCEDKSRILIEKGADTNIIIKRNGSIMNPLLWCLKNERYQLGLYIITSGKTKKQTSGELIVKTFIHAVCSSIEDKWLQKIIENRILHNLNILQSSCAVVI